MASYAQLKANRDNAKKSTGPRTEPGKKRSSKNAVRHSLFSEHLFVDYDEHQMFEALLSELEQELEPVGPIEAALVERIAIGFWRQRRLNIAEGAMVRLNSRDESLEHQRYLAPPYGRTFPGQSRGSGQYREHESKIKSDSDWVAAILEEIAGLSNPTIANIKATAPKTYAYLEAEAEKIDETPASYLKNLEDGPEELFEEIRKICGEILSKIEEARVDSAYRKDIRKMSFLPQKSDLLVRYQTMIDNQLYRALQEFHQLKARRLKTLDLTVVTSRKGNDSSAEQ